MNPMTAISADTVVLGTTDIVISALGIGTWAWGDKWFWGYGSGTYTDDDLRAAFETAVAHGVNLFDTAEAYGRGRSEVLLGTFVRASGRPVVIATKCFPYPYRLSRHSLHKALRASLSRLGMERVDLYQMHWPFPPVPITAWMEAMAAAYEDGLIRAIGVSNYTLAQTRQAQDALARRGLRLASNQVEYSLLQRRIERNGLLDYCRANGITILAYSPLAMGLLTGKYSPATPPPGIRGRRYGRAFLARIQPLIGLLREIGQAHGHKTPAEVALNWVMCKGAVPLAGVKTAAQALANVGALGWRLDPDEVAALDRAADAVA
jgi:aryl-alcohol dehydrogenase-like predicted oxidoreductase